MTEESFSELLPSGPIPNQAYIYKVNDQHVCVIAVNGTAARAAIVQQFGSGTYELACSMILQVN